MDIVLVDQTPRSFIDGGLAGGRHGKDFIVGSSCHLKNGPRGIERETGGTTDHGGRIAGMAVPRRNLSHAIYNRVTILGNSQVDPCHRSIEDVGNEDLGQLASVV